MERAKFEILCATMHQKDFKKIEEMNIHSNVVFTNQTNETSLRYEMFDTKHYAKMFSTETRGVGINRNIGLLNATAEYCLFADDDVIYVDNLENIIVNEFELHKDADVIIFYFETDSIRKQVKYNKTRKCHRFEKMPWACFRIAFKLDSVKKNNVWFSTLFGGGCVFPSGEDSLWLADAKKAGLNFYVSENTIGKVSFDKSTWFTGYDERYFFGKGAYYKAAHPKLFFWWKLYFAIRTSKMTKMSFKEKMEWMNVGFRCFENLTSFDQYYSCRK